MIKYNTLGELLQAYRKFNNISQLDFAISMGVDVRTAQRWENNATLIKQTMEDELIKNTLIPHQIIRNLNSSIPIPTYFDFVIRKYSISRLGMVTPDVEWVKRHIDIYTESITGIKTEADFNDIYKYISWQYTPKNKYSIEVLKKASEICPSLNIIMRNQGGYYTGHYCVLPIRKYIYQKLKNREMSNSEITIHDIVEDVIRDKPVYYTISHSAETNDLLEYLLAAIMRYFQENENGDFTVASFSNRHDTRQLSKQLGLNPVWHQEDENQLQNNIVFSEGNFVDSIF